MQIKRDKREEILGILANQDSWEQEEGFVPGETLVRYSGAVYDQK